MIRIQKFLDERADSIDEYPTQTLYIILIISITNLIFPRSVRDFNSHPFVNKLANNIIRHKYFIQSSRPYNHKYI